jgi:hypothetical protein
VLEAAAIPRSRCGTERTARLSRDERQLYRWILDHFAHAAPPTAAQLAEQARALDLDPEAALATLSAEDLVHTGDGGAVLVAYPFSARPCGHRVMIDERRTVEAMCAIDALGIASMLNQPVEITSPDPLTGLEIWSRVSPGEGAWWARDSGRPRRQQLRIRAKLRWLLRRAQLLRDDRDCRAIPARTRARRRHTDLDTGSNRNRPCDL